MSKSTVLSSLTDEYVTCAFGNSKKWGLEKSGNFMMKEKVGTLLHFLNYTRNFSGKFNFSSGAASHVPIWIIRVAISRKNEWSEGHKKRKAHKFACCRHEILLRLRNSCTRRINRLAQRLPTTPNDRIKNRSSGGVDIFWKGSFNKTASKDDNKLHVLDLCLWYSTASAWQI